MSVPLCVDCRFFERRSWFNTDPSPMRCTHPCVETNDLVYGGRPSAAIERKEGRKCGPEGKLWKPREDGRGMP